MILFTNQAVLPNIYTENKVCFNLLNLFVQPENVSVFFYAWVKHVNKLCFNEKLLSSSLHFASSCATLCIACVLPRFIFISLSGLSCVHMCLSPKKKKLYLVIYVLILTQATSSLQEIILFQLIRRNVSTLTN